MEYSDTWKGYWGVGILWKYKKNIKAINRKKFLTEFIENKEKCALNIKKNRNKAFFMKSFTRVLYHKSRQ